VFNVPIPYRERAPTCSAVFFTQPPGSIALAITLFWKDTAELEFFCASRRLRHCGTGEYRHLRPRLNQRTCGVVVSGGGSTMFPKNGQGMNALGRGYGIVVLERVRWWEAERPRTVKTNHATARAGFGESADGASSECRRPIRRDWVRGCDPRSLTPTLRSHQPHVPDANRILVLSAAPCNGHARLRPMRGPEYVAALMNGLFHPRIFAPRSGLIRGFKEPAAGTHHWVAPEQWNFIGCRVGRASA